MTLSDQQILNALECGDLEIDPFSHHQLNANSYDVTLNHVGFAELLPGRDEQNPIVDPFDQGSFNYRHFNIPEGDSILMQPGEFLIASIVERTHFKGNICGQLMGKSSLARLGLSIHVTAGWADTGWNGTYVLELVNHSGYRFRLTPGMKIGQIVFFKTGPVLEKYGDKKGSKYQNQLPGQGSKYYLNEGV